MEVIQVKDQAIEDLEQQLKVQREQIAAKYVYHSPYLIFFKKNSQIIL